MGNATSSSFFMRPELNNEDFTNYSQAEWRSERSKELDKLGGPGRPACPRGQSFSSKTLFLRHQLIQSAEEMQNVITPPTQSGSVQKPARIDMAEFALHTDKRAVERREADKMYRVQDHGDLGDPFSRAKAPSSWERKERRFLSNLSPAAAALALAENEVEKTSAQLRRPGLMRSSSSGAMFGPERSSSFSPIKSIITSKNVAEWRKRCHAARRRVILIILTVLRLKRGRPRPPSRLSRLDDLSFLIPTCLGADKARDKSVFLTEFLSNLELQDEVAATKAAISLLKKQSPVRNLIASEADYNAARFQSPSCPRPPIPRSAVQEDQEHFDRSSLPLKLSLLKTPPLSKARPPSALLSSSSAPPLPPFSPSILEKGKAQGSQSRDPSPTLKRSSVPSLPQRPSSVHSPPAVPLLPTAVPLPPRWNFTPSVKSNVTPTPRSRRTSRLTSDALPSAPLATPREKGDPFSLIHMSLDDLKEKLEAKEALLYQSTSMISMILNRCNLQWAEDVQQWRKPLVADVQSETIWSKGSEVQVYKADLLRKLRQGKIAVQIFAGCDESVELDSESGQRGTLWGSDPWQLVQAIRPGLMPMMKDRIMGVGLGGRTLCSLVQQLLLIGGKEAVSHMRVVLHLSEEQEEEVVRELEDRKFYGLDRSNFIFLVQQRQGGYVYDVLTKLWVERPPDEGEGGSEGGKAPKTYGSGHAMAMLTWPSEAFVLGEDGIKSPLLLSAFEFLESSGVEWIISRRMRDLNLLSHEGFVDSLGLPYRMWVKDKSSKRLAMIIDGVSVDSMTLARQHGNILLHNTKSDSTAEVSLSSLSTPELSEMLEGMKQKGLVVGLGRNLLHLSSLKAAVNKSLDIFHPRLEFADGSVNVKLGVEDISLSVKTAALMSRHSSSMILGGDSMEALITATLDQDHSSGFRSMVVDLVNGGKKQGAKMVMAKSVGGGAADDSMIYVVFVSSNQISQRAVSTAVYLARPGRDEVRLVTVVPNEVQRAGGLELLSEFNKQAVRAMLSVRSEVLVRGDRGSLLDMMEGYLDKECRRCQCLVVMGSQKITSSVFDSVVGSVTLSFIRRLVGIPAIVVTLNSKQSPSPETTQALRVLVEVEPQSRGVLKLVSQSFLSGRQEKEKGTHLFLAHVHAVDTVTRKQESDHRRLLESFELLAAGLRTPSSRSLFLSGKADEAISEAVAELAVNMMALQLVPGSKALSTSIVKLMRSSKAATLIYTQPHSQSEEEAK